MPQWLSAFCLRNEAFRIVGPANSRVWDRDGADSGGMEVNQGPGGRAGSERWSRLRGCRRLREVEQNQRGVAGSKGMEVVLQDVQHDTGRGAGSKVVEQVVGDGSYCKKWSRVGRAGYNGWSRLLGLETTSVGADYGG